MRHERKYRITDAGYFQVNAAMQNIFGVFDKSFPDRWVNSIYFDSIGFQALQDNLSGISRRSKFRLRWYGEELKVIDRPVLEEKIKNNMLGFKKHRDMPSGSLDQLSAVLNANQLIDKDLYPVVLVRYLRTYLESFDGRVRATIDRKLQYFRMNDLVADPFPVCDEAIILEVKYDQRIEGEIDDILQSIPFRLTKNSKFVNAMKSLWLS